MSRAEIHARVRGRKRMLIASRNADESGLAAVVSCAGERLVAEMRPLPAGADAARRRLLIDRS